MKRYQTLAAVRTHSSRTAQTRFRRAREPSSAVSSLNRARRNPALVSNDRPTPRDRISPRLSCRPRPVDVVPERFRRSHRPGARLRPETARFPARHDDRASAGPSRRSRRPPRASHPARVPRRPRHLSLYGVAGRLTGRARAERIDRHVQQHGKSAPADHAVPGADGEHHVPVELHRGRERHSGR